MKLPKTKCPRCGSIQKFGQQRREVDNDEIEIFIRCGMCRWEQVVIRGNSDIIRRDREIQRLKIRASKDPSLLKVLRRRKRRNG